MINYEACIRYNKFIQYAKCYYPQSNNVAKDLTIVLDNYSCSKHSRNGMIKFMCEVFVEIFHGDARIMGEVFFRAMYGFEMKSKKNGKWNGMASYLRPPTVNDILWQIVGQLQVLQVRTNDGTYLFDIGEIDPKLEKALKVNV